MITARAIGVLEEILINPQHGGAKGLSARLGEGKDAIQAAITLLRKEGYVETVNHRLSNGRFTKNLRVTESGNQFLEIRIYTLQRQLNPNANLLLDINTDLLDINRIATREEKEEKMDYEDAPSYIAPEDMEEHRQKQQKRKHKEKMEFHEKNTAERMKHRDENNPFSWTPTDSSFEFADRMHGLWHVAPWKVTRSSFRFALDTKRSEYNTNGLIECQMMDIYFGKLKHNKKINDPELIWKMFIKEFGSLYLQVTRENVTEDQVSAEVEKSLSQKSRRLFSVQD